MLKSVFGLLFCFSMLLFSYGQNCCPQITQSSISSGICVLSNGGTCGICKDAPVKLSIYNGKNLPEDGLISWYYSTTKGFNPANGQGTIIGSSSLPTSTCDNASSVKFNEVMVKPPTNDDNFTSGPKGEWIELIGPPGFDLSCYIITDGDWAITIPPGYAIGSDGLFVIGSSSVSGPEVDLDVGGCGCVYSPPGFPNNVLTLDNTGEYLLLFDGSSFVDAFKWGTPSLFNSFPFGDLVSSGQIPTADVIGCVKTVPFSFPSFESNSSTTATNETYSRLPDFSGTWQIACPTIGKCNAGVTGIFPLNTDANFNGIQCNQTIYVKAYVTPGKSGCPATLSPEYTLFVSCPVKDLKQTLCSYESIQINGTNYDKNNPKGQEILTGQSYFGCDSTVNVDLKFYPEVTASIIGDQDLCLGQTANITISFTGGAPYTFTYNINGFFGNTITTNSNPYTLQIKPQGSITVDLEEVSDKNLCEGTVMGQAIISIDAPKASLLGIDSTLCAGDTILIPIDLSGYPDFKLSYTLNGKADSIISSNNIYYLKLVPTDTLIIALKEMTDDLGCKASLSGIDTLYVRPALEVLNLEEICNPGNTYDVKFILSGGDPSSWSVIGPGILTDSLFSSTGLTGGSSYQFIIKDGSKCNSDTISNTVLCNCQNGVGSMDKNTLHACIDGSVQGLYNNNGELLQSTDILIYILHENSANVPGFIWSSNTTADFSFVAGMIPGKTYYISAIVGKETSPGIIDFTDECIRVAPGTPVIFHDFPSLDLSGDQSICEGNCTDISLYVLGELPFDIKYVITDKLGNQSFNQNLNTASYIQQYCSPANGGSDNITLTVSAVKDLYCSLLLNESFIITVSAPAINNLTKDLCIGQTLIVNGNNYSETNPSGTETITGGSYAGCDSIVNVNLSFVNTVVENYTKSICPDGNIVINGTLFDKNNTSGSFSFPGGSSAGCDSVLNVNISFYTINTGFINQSLCKGEKLIVNGKTYDETNPTGTETLGETSWLGCDSIVNIQLSFLPIANFFYKDTLCKTDIVLINGKQYDFNKPAGLETLKNGSYHGCDSIIQVQLLFINDITASVSGPSSLCPGENAQIVFNFSSPGNYDVDFDDGTGTIVKLNNISDGYLYDLGSLNQNTSISLKNVINLEKNCPLILGPDFTINVDALSASVTILSDYNGFNISCNGASDGSVMATATSGTAPYTYVWSNGSNAAMLDNLGAGSISITITDAKACSYSNTLILSEPLPIQFNFTTDDAGCDGLNGGSLSIETVSGGVQIFSYIIDNGESTLLAGNEIINGINKGVHQFTITDANGCNTTQPFEIKQSISSNLLVDLGPDLFIEQGKQLGLNTSINFNQTQIIWSPVTGLNCSNCLNPVVKPDTSTTYTITVTDKNGCEATDQLRVNIISTDVAFIPNVFSPNGDGINDKLNFFCSDKVMNIKHFAIFDRWGESVYDAIDIPVNDLDYGWDGKQKGQKANSAVYVYYIELTLIDGTVKILKGDINLIR